MTLSGASRAGLAGPLAGPLAGIVGKGLLLGALAGALWVATRRYGGAPPRLIDWARVRTTALALGDRADEADEEAPALAGSRAALTREYEAMVRQSEELIGGYLGLRLAGRPESVFVFGRQDWIEANLASFELLFEPLEQVNQSAMAEGSVGGFVVGTANQWLLSSQIGLLIGFLSRRVLGQYDLALLGREPLVNGARGQLYFVEPNIARLQERLDLDAREFRLWIALHETTHAYEFEGHPWLREHLNGLLQRYFDSLSRDILGPRGRPGGGVDLVQRIGANLLRSRHALELVMSAEQRAIFQELQALMCVVEGYSNHVMDRVGSRLLASYPTLKARFEHRLQDRSLGERLFARLTGLDVKLEQYELGERFVGEVVAQRDITYMDRVWASPWHLPSLEEIREPARWVARVAG